MHLNHLKTMPPLSPLPHPWKNFLSRNQSLLPERLVTAALGNYSLLWVLLLARVSAHPTPPCSNAKLCLTLCNSTDCSTPCFPVLHHFPEFAQTHVHWCHPSISSSSSPSLAFNLSQRQGLFQLVSTSHQVIKVLELQHQSFQWIFSVDFL